jgi:hypothetical protein
MLIPVGFTNVLVDFYRRLAAFCGEGNIKIVIDCFHYANILRFMTIFVNALLERCKFVAFEMLGDEAYELQGKIVWGQQ